MILKTYKGSVIQRSKYGVGKEIGNNLYFHIDYISQIKGIDTAFLTLIAKVLPKNLLPNDFKPRCIVLNRKEKWIRFDEAPDFDTAREPHAGLTYKMFYDECRIEKRQIDQIWHHKWLWVGDDYNGFDVQESFNWSKKWLSKLNEVASGYPNKWELQLKKVGLA